MKHNSLISVFKDLDLPPSTSKTGVGTNPPPTPALTPAVKLASASLSSMALKFAPEVKGRKARATFSIVTEVAGEKQKSVITVSPDHAIRWLLQICQDDTAGSTMLRTAVSHFADDLRRQH